MKNYLNYKLLQYFPLFFHWKEVLNETIDSYKLVILKIEFSKVLIEPKTFFKSDAIFQFKCGHLSFQIYNISKPNCPSLDMKLLGFEDGNDMFFHPDGSKRLIHLAGKNLL